MKIGILQAGHASDALRHAYGDYDAMFATLLDGHGFAFAAWDVEGMVFPPGVHDADGWLVTGSRHGVYDDLPFVAQLERFVRDAHAADVPLVGICFGHQIVAQALGGRVEKFAGGWALGRTEYDLDGGGRIALNAWHQDQVVERPDGAVPVGRSAFCENAMLAYGGRAFTVQPHPEFGSDLVAEMVATRRGTGTYPDDRMDAAARDAAKPIQADAIARAIARFFLTRQAHVDA